MTGSAWLEERVRGCAAAAGTALEVARPVPGAPAPASLLEVWGADALGQAAGSPPTTVPRVVVTAEAAPDAVWRAALEVGARSVLQLPGGEADLVEALLAAADDRAADAVVVGVLGACGGAGASVLAVALAHAGGRRSSARSSRPGAGGVLLADLDALGGGADVLLGLEDAAGLRWGDLAGVRGTLRPDVLEGTLPRCRGVDVLAPTSGAGPDAAGPGGGPAPEAAVSAVVAAARRSHDLVVLDMPRGARGVEHLLPVVGPLVLVVPPQVRAGVAAGRSLAHLERVAPGADVRVVVRAAGGRGTARGAGLRPAEVARALGRPLAGVAPYDAHLVAEDLRGRPFPRRDGALVRWAATAVDDLRAAGPRGRGGPGAADGPPGRRGRGAATSSRAPEPAHLGSAFDLEEAAGSRGGPPGPGGAAGRRGWRPDGGPAAVVGPPAVRRDAVARAAASPTGAAR